MEQTISPELVSEYAAPIRSQIAKAKSEGKGSTNYSFFLSRRYPGHPMLMQDAILDTLIADGCSVTPFKKNPNEVIGGVLWDIFISWDESDTAKAKAEGLVFL